MKKGVVFMANRYYKIIAGSHKGKVGIIRERNNHLVCFYPIDGNIYRIWKHENDIGPLYAKEKHV